MPKLDGYLQIKQAAEYLGVCQEEDYYARTHVFGAAFRTRQLGLDSGDAADRTPAGFDFPLERHSPPSLVSRGLLVVGSYGGRPIFFVALAGPIFVRPGPKFVRRLPWKDGARLRDAYHHGMRELFGAGLGRGVHHLQFDGFNAPFATPDDSARGSDRARQAPT
jgi:hypothetical protein